MKEHVSPVDIMNERVVVLGDIIFSIFNILFTQISLNIGYDVALGCT